MCIRRLVIAMVAGVMAIVALAGALSMHSSAHGADKCLGDPAWPLVLESVIVGADTAVNPDTAEVFEWEAEGEWDEWGLDSTWRAYLDVRTDGSIRAE